MEMLHRNSKEKARIHNINLENSNYLSYNNRKYVSERCFLGNCIDSGCYVVKYITDECAFQEPETVEQLSA